MEVAEKRDRKAVQPCRPAAERNILAHNPEMVWRDQRYVGDQRRAANGQCEADKLSPGNRENGQSISGP
jgi:hypothetical protein